jgi:hypothetical protein
VSQLAVTAQPPSLEQRDGANAGRLEPRARQRCRTGDLRLLIRDTAPPGDSRFPLR